MGDYGEFLFADWEKPGWDSYFMAQAFVIAMRSIDTSTKHGCVVVDKNHRPLSFGYNGPTRGCDDKKIPMRRPDKYKFMAHAEDNAIANAANRGISLNESIFYVTGHPCVECMRRIVNVGAEEVIYGPVDSACISKDDKDVIKFMRSARTLAVRPFQGDYRSILESALKYDEIKVGG